MRPRSLPWLLISASTRTVTTRVWWTCSPEAWTSTSPPPSTTCWCCPGPSCSYLGSLLPYSWPQAPGFWFFCPVLLSLFFCGSLPKYTWEKYIAVCLVTDLADITATYLSSRDSCFWIVESRGQMVGMVAALPVEDPLLQKKQLRLCHLSVSLEHRREGIGKAMVRTVCTGSGLQ